MRFDKVVSLDLETSGYSPKKHNILEIGAILYDPKTNESSSFSSLINIPVPEHIEKITGISSKLSLKEGIPLDDAVFDFLIFVFLQSNKPLFVGHNIKEFDLPFLSPELKKHRTPQPLTRMNTWDTMLDMRAEIAKKKLRTFTRTQEEARTYRTKEKCNLTAAAKHYNIEYVEKHRALPDARVTLEIFKKQINKNRYRIF